MLSTTNISYLLLLVCRITLFLVHIHNRLTILLRSHEIQNQFSIKHKALTRLHRYVSSWNPCELNAFIECAEQSERFFFMIARVKLRFNNKCDFFLCDFHTWRAWWSFFLMGIYNNGWTYNNWCHWKIDFRRTVIWSILGATIIVAMWWLMTRWNVEWTFNCVHEWREFT